MRIPLSSNVVNAIYVILFDAALPVILAKLVQVILSSRNVMATYGQNPKKVSFEEVQFSFFVHQGMSERRVGRNVAFVSTLIIVLSIAGGFSFNGVSREVTKEKIARVLVDRASAENHLDFESHVAANGSLVSASVVHIYSAMMCRSLRSKEKFVYSAVNNHYENDDLESVRWPKNTLLRNTTCRLERNRFVETTAISTASEKSPPDTSNCIFKPRWKEGARTARVDARTDKNCPVTIRETWCSSLERKFCVGLIATEIGFNTFAIELPKSPGSSLDGLYKFGSLSVEASYVREPIESHALRSMAFLLASNGASYPYFAREMALLTIYQKSPVRMIETVDETEVNVLLLIGTAGLAALMTTALSASAYISRQRHKVRPERTHYNSFYSVGDLLLYLEDRGNGDRFSKDQSNSIVVKVIEGEPHLSSFARQDRVETFLSRCIERPEGPPRV